MITIPDTLTNLASTIEFGAGSLSRKATVSRSGKIRSSGMRYSLYSLTLTWDVLTDDQAHQLSAIIDYAATSDQKLEVGFGARGVNSHNVDTATILSQSAGSDTVTVTGLTPGVPYVEVGGYVRFTGSEKLHKVYSAPLPDGSGNSVMTFSPRLMDDVHTSAVLNNATLIGYIESSVVPDKWSGGESRSSMVKFVEAV